MRYKTLDEIENLVRAFEECTLPRSEWTHHAHLTIALWYLTHYPQLEAIDCIRDRIKKYNTANGIKITKDSGYHETITLFWVRIVLCYLVVETGNCSILDLANGLINSYGNIRHLTPKGERRYIASLYSSICKPIIVYITYRLITNSLVDVI